MMALSEWIKMQKGQRLPAGIQVVSLELADGSFAVKVQHEGETGYMHVGKDWVSLGVQLTLDDISRLRAH